MSQQPSRPTAGAGDALFDRYALPKVALTLVLVASLAGTWVTTGLAGDAGAAVVAAKWAYLVALGVLTGGLLWKHAFVRPRDLGTGASEYCAAMYARFDRVATLAAPVVAVGGLATLVHHAGHFGAGPGVAGLGAALLGWTALVAATSRRSAPVDRQFRSPAGLLALALAVGLTAATAVAEVALRGFDPVAAGVRVLHLLAFAVWLGGAVWNVFVAVPEGQRRPTTDVVRAAGQQLERFRWAVRFVIPTIALTGLHQAVDALGTRAAVYLGTGAGLAVLGKLGAIGVLLVIFRLCPMWRACSPIDGVCDLEDLGGGDADERPDDTDERPVDGAAEVVGGD